MKERLLQTIINYWHVAAIFTIIFYGWRLRLNAYGDPRLSIGTNDSHTYIESASHIPFSWASFTSRRPFTMALLYRLLQPESGYDLYHTTNPAAEKQNRNRVLQPGLDRVVVFHQILSLVSWTTLTIAVSRHLSKKILKVFSAALITMFAFSPQIVDWDAILASESLAISLFTLMFALLIEIAFWFSSTNFQISRGKVILLANWLIILFLWTFVRDTHIYAVLWLILLFLPLMLLRTVHRSVFFNATFLLLILVVAFSLTTTRASSRWQRPLLENIIFEIRPFPKRMEFFHARGMPDPHSQDFYPWAKEDGIKVYSQFLLSHPGYVSLSLLEGLEIVVSENIQPYFREPEIGVRAILVSLGNLVHPKSSVIFLVAPLLLLCLALLSYQLADLRLFTWTWLGTWGVLSSVLMLFISYFGDAAGIIRHSYGSVMMFRLSLWIFLMVILDSLIDHSGLELSNVANFFNHKFYSIFHFMKAHRQSNQPKNQEP